MRVRYLLLFTALPHRAIEHHWRRPGREVSKDTLYLPDGSRARNNADLVTAARNMGAGAIGSR